MEYASDQESSGGFFDDFFSAAQQRVGQILQPVMAPEPGSPSLGSQLFEAIYQYGRGRVDQAREKAVGAFLMTSEGKKVQAEGARQTLMQYAPWIVAGIIGIFMLGAMIRR